VPEHHFQLSISHLFMCTAFASIVAYVAVIDLLVAVILFLPSSIGAAMVFFGLLRGGLMMLGLWALLGLPLCLLLRLLAAL